MLNCARLRFGFRERDLIYKFFILNFLFGGADVVIIQIPVVRAWREGRLESRPQTVPIERG